VGGCLLRENASSVAIGFLVFAFFVSFSGAVHDGFQPVQLRSIQHRMPQQGEN